ncbi:MAG: Cell division protein ZapA [uncultured Thiotrichaceae bacterium]|uniref:Cell division protein ZapA n=1 Tax=uncultured Thiotrichaceae bacterium TaxID=298394 RepID=A0A6S6U3N8_9GAMM|nr:MAG: Cell division protein ZapA [uncultured Thiotrichaceae bacterium]
MNAQNEQIVAMKVSIFGREYPVSCPAGEENALLHSAKFVDTEMRKVRESGKVIGSDRIAVMVSLNIAHELLVLRHHQNNDSPVDTSAADTKTDSQSRARIDAMNQQIDARLEQFQQYLPK